MPLPGQDDLEASPSLPPPPASEACQDVLEANCAFGLPPPVSEPSTIGETATVLRRSSVNVPEVRCFQGSSIPKAATATCLPCCDSVSCFGGAGLAQELRTGNTLFSSDLSSSLLFVPARNKM